MTISGISPGSHNVVAFSVHITLVVAAAAVGNAQGLSWNQVHKLSYKVHENVHSSFKEMNVKHVSLSANFIQGIVASSYVAGFRVGWG